MVSLTGDRGKIGLFLVCAALVLILDQLSKLWFRSPDARPMELLPGFLDLAYHENRGAVFGLPINQSFLIAIIVAVLLIIVFLFLRYFRLSTALRIAAIGLVFGGAIGNLIDRLRFAFVVDFIVIHLKDFFTHSPNKLIAMSLYNELFLFEF